MKSVLISGGTGSFGQAFTERLLKTQVERIVIYSRGEHLQGEMAHRFNDGRLRFFIGDVRDQERLEMAMRDIDTVVHAAALKIVPTAEYNPTECIATNVTGAENVVRAALRAHVKNVVGLSTDKAVNPINLYGASKLAAEKIFIAANALAAGACHFNVVRYGNVSGSRGSVVPLFKKLQAEGRPLTVTHRDMTRFWITMDQSIDLVLVAINDGEEGHDSRILVPKIPSIRILDLVEAISGHRDGYTMSGIRPGEKIHETLITEDEARTTVERRYHYVINQDRGLEFDHVPMGFRYTSDSNTQWLSVDQLRELVNG